MRYYQVSYTYPGGAARTVTESTSLTQAWRQFQRDNPDVTVQSVTSECGQTLAADPDERHWQCPECRRNFSEGECHCRREPIGGMFYPEAPLIVQCPRCPCEFMPEEKNYAYPHP